MVKWGLWSFHVTHTLILNPFTTITLCRLSSNYKKVPFSAVSTVDVASFLPLFQKKTTPDFTVEQSLWVPGTKVVRVRLLKPWQCRILVSRHSWKTSRLHNERCLFLHHNQLMALTQVVLIFLVIVDLKPNEGMSLITMEERNVCIASLRIKNPSLWSNKEASSRLVTFWCTSPKSPLTTWKYCKSSPWFPTNF
jgi:hypothetical protein